MALRPQEARQISGGADGRQGVVAFSFLEEAQRGAKHSNFLRDVIVVLFY
jgi:hypothetical protein